MPVEPETYPGSNVFINKLDIRDPKILNEAEASLTWARTEAYRDSPASGCFDLEHLRQIHHTLFQDLYAWAGELRSYDTRASRLSRLVSSQLKSGQSIFSHMYII